MRNIQVNITAEDIANAICGNRSRCVIANALKRQFQLNGNGYVNVDGGGASYSADGLRHVFKMPRTAIRYLRDFDVIGETRGQDTAREKMEPRSFMFKEVEIHSTTPPASRERKDQVNQARRIADAARKAAGITPKTYKRWVGV